MAYQRWEYKIHFELFDGTNLMEGIGQLTTQFAELGDDGWELTISEVLYTVGTTVGVLYTFKRPK